MEAKDELVKRLNLYLKSKGISVNKFATIAGINQSGLRRTLLGLMKPSAEYLTAILDAFPELSAEWLMRGKGQMLNNDVSEDELAALAGVVSDLTETLKEKNKIIAMLNKQIEENKKGNSND